MTDFAKLALGFAAAQYQSTLAVCQFVASNEDAIYEALRLAAQAQEDAERIDWIEKHACVIQNGEPLPWKPFIRDQIDAAIAAEKKP